MNQNPIVFTRFQSQGGAMFNDIYSIDPDGANETKLTANPGPDGEYMDNAAPRYNKDKTMLAFVSNRNHPNRKFNIFFLDLATKKTAQITSGNLDIMNVGQPARVFLQGRQGAPADPHGQHGRNRIREADRRPGRACESAVVAAGEPDHERTYTRKT